MQTTISHQLLFLHGNHTTAFFTMLHTLNSIRSITSRCLATQTRTPITVQRSYASFGSTPSPPRLPKEEQEIFEELQKKSTGAFSTPRTVETNATLQQASSQSSGDAAIQATGQGEELHPNVRRGAPPEFKGDVNPKTGEVGGPKNEPLRWGSQGDYSYNGRVTDF